MRWSMIGRSMITITILLLAQLSAQDKRLKLKQADLLENKTINGRSVQLLTGNVIFTKGKMTIKCERARYQEKQARDC